ncbi:MAG: hypothetical protein CVV52_19195 [Spirochaetae bacterium HGW-Spirochaetae-8]|nr:MAG: hypothetical protein CVV52_19195 [Spirochaetae bacterium HGW-Spirochaetae-8]
MKGGSSWQSHLPSDCTCMPVQCGLNWGEFQEEKLDRTKMDRLRELCRPRRCPYCGEPLSMRGHGFVERYIVLGDLTSVRLQVPRYRCFYCSRTLRVLPLELHNHCNHLSEAIIGVLRARIGAGRFADDHIRVARTIQRHWYRLFKKRCQENIRMAGQAGAEAMLRQLPPFSVLFRSGYETRRESELFFHRRTIHLVRPLVVCLDTS